MYIVLLEKKPLEPSKQKDLINRLAIILNNGYTYQDLHKEILSAFHSHNPFPFQKFTRPSNRNLVKQGTMYYHKEFRLRNPFPVSTYDMESGTITSSEVEYYLEPVASYTMDDLLKYFYSKGMADMQEYNPKRMAGIFNHMIETYGLDKLMFMIEGAARMYDAEHKIFSLSDFSSYNSVASQYLEEIKNNCKYSGGDKYAYRKRVLFM